MIRRMSKTKMVSKAINRINRTRTVVQKVTRTLVQKVTRTLVQKVTRTLVQALIQKTAKAIHQTRTLIRKSQTAVSHSKTPAIQKKAENQTMSSQSKKLKNKRNLKSRHPLRIANQAALKTATLMTNKLTNKKVATRKRKPL